MSIFDVLEKFISLLDFNRFWNYVTSAEFIVYSFFAYCCILPLLIFIVVYIMNFFIDYSSFKKWKREQKQKFEEEEEEEQDIE